MGNNNFDVIVVGGGPAGILAAGNAANQGASVLLLEKMEKPARKLRITGKGRCNITNTKPMEEFLHEVFPEPRFLRDAFNEFFSDDIISLLNNQGVETIVERGQRVFPKSGKARDVAEGLVKWAKGEGVVFKTNARVEKVNVKDGSIVSITYEDMTGKVNETVSCKAIILATGGKSYPATGSTGDGYSLAENCGHTIVNLRPVLVGVETKQKLDQADGLTLKNVSLSLKINEKNIASEFGELEITKYGFSGPIVLKLSRLIVDYLLQGIKPLLHLDLKPALDHNKLDARLQREIEESPRIAVVDLARRLLPKDLAIFMVEDLGLAAQKNLARLTANERKSIRMWLKELQFTVNASRQWDEAIVTAGGVSLKEIDPHTMESKIVKGLFFAGEVIDIDASTGGYNLQVAYSTGWLAGKSAAKKIFRFSSK
ncbi:MAG: NAD(P)/FAD-dependent oxidoreductase [Bacteroidales bacterium]